MVETSQMPKSLHSGIDTDAVGEALLQHYNMGITNPWFEIGVSQQETYNRRRLPWSGKSYSVSQDGNVSGPNVEQLPEALTDQWENLADASRDISNGEGSYGDLETLYDEFLLKVGDRLSN
jgi:hypothetical protein